MSQLIHLTLKSRSVDDPDDFTIRLVDSIVRYSLIGPYGILMTSINHVAFPWSSVMNGFDSFQLRIRLLLDMFHLTHSDLIGNTY